jgi:peptidoglycan hydrolase-like protein with peptidoglycan-binding domain
MLSLWGSKFLGDRSYKAIDILRYYYGEQIYINSTDNIEGILPWPEGELTAGSTSEAVRQLQEKLKILSHAFNEIPFITEDGVFSEETQNAVMAFQRIFDLPVTGIVDAPTWYKISQMYNRLKDSSNLCQLYQ